MGILSVDSPEMLALLRDSHPEAFAGDVGKRTKFGNVRVHDPEYGTFDSKHELRCYHDLVLRQKAGEIFNLQKQVKFYFGDPDNDRWMKGDSGRRIFYQADFHYDEKDPETGELVSVVADAKGKKTKEYQLKKAMMRYFWNIEIVEM